MAPILKIIFLVPALIQVALCLGAGERLAPAISARSTSSDHVPYVMDQGKCKEVEEGPTRDCRWPAGLYPFVDQLAKGGRIIAYQIKWFSNRWSGWFVPGVNDLDGKFNPSSRPCTLPYKKNSLRRVWASFYDHTHKYIICTH